MGANEVAKLGQRLLATRQLAGLTQSEVGRGIGVGPQQVHRYERGAETIPTLRLAAFCRLLDADPAVLLLGEGALDEIRGDRHDVQKNAALARDLSRLEPALRERLKALIDVLTTLDASPA